MRWLAIALIGSWVFVGAAQHENDLLFGAQAGQATVVQPVPHPVRHYDPSDPEAVHQHVVFASATMPDRDNPLLFQFELINALDWDGNAVGNSGVHTLEFVPEPASLTALGVGLLTLGLRRRMRRKV